MKRLLSVLTAVLLGACSGATGPQPVTPPPVLHDPEAFVHFYYLHDSTGVIGYPYSRSDSLVIRWYKGVTQDTLLATMEVAAGDSVCAYFLVPATDSIMNWWSIWRHNGVTKGGTEVGPFNAANPALGGSYFDIDGAADTLIDSYSLSIASNSPTSFCPPGVARDSVSP